jgi:hypothetical protein
MATDRGMWLYPNELYNPYRINPLATSVASWVSARIAAAPTTPIRAVYVAASAASVTDATWLAWYRDLKSKLYAISPLIKMYAAAGVPEWADAGATQSHPQYMKAANWASQVLTPKGPLAAGSGNFWRLFDGVMLDVEPNWLFAATPPTAQQMNNWLNMQSQVRAAVISPASNPGGSASAKFWAIMQFWLHTLTVNGQPLDRQLMKLTHGTAIMSYRDTVGPAAGANGSIISVSLPAIASGAALNIPIRLTVECDNTGTSYVDYAGQSRALMESHMAQVMTYLTVTTNNPIVKGIDAHHFASWSAMAA